VIEAHSTMKQVPERMVIVCFDVGVEWRRRRGPGRSGHALLRPDTLLFPYHILFASFWNCKASDLHRLVIVRIAQHTAMYF
jgi:hypothetical protein